MEARSIFWKCYFPIAEGTWDKNFIFDWGIWMRNIYLGKQINILAIESQCCCRRLQMAWEAPSRIDALQSFAYKFPHYPPLLLILKMTTLTLLSYWKFGHDMLGEGLESCCVYPSNPMRSFFVKLYLEWKKLQSAAEWLSAYIYKAGHTKLVVASAQ